MSGLNQFRLDKMVTVTDNWYPCYEGNKVRVSLFLNYHKSLDYQFVRICVWGADDFGLEMDYEDKDYDKLVAKYHEWKDTIFDKIPNKTNKKWFIDKGFYNA